MTYTSKRIQSIWALPDDWHGHDNKCDITGGVAKTAFDNAQSIVDALDDDRYDTRGMSILPAYPRNVKLESFDDTHASVLAGEDGSFRLHEDTDTRTMKISDAIEMLERHLDRLRYRDDRIQSISELPQGWYYMDPGLSGRISVTALNNAQAIVDRLEHDGYDTGTHPCGTRMHITPAFTSHVQIDTDDEQHRYADAYVIIRSDGSFEIVQVAKHEDDDVYERKTTDIEEVVTFLEGRLDKQKD